MAIWVMLAAMEPVPEFAAARLLTERHLRELPIDDAYLAAVAGPTALNATLGAPTAQPMGTVPPAEALPP